jgi:hypothetical protein
MSTRQYSLYTTSTSEPVGAQPGDAWYNPTTNILYIRVLTNGTTAAWAQQVISTTANNVAVAGNLSVGGTPVAGGAASTSTTSGSVTVTGGVGVSDSVYAGNRLGLASVTGASAVYQSYNNATGTLDVVFG